MEYAVIATGGKQYLVQPQKQIKIEKLDVEEGKSLTFDSVLLTGLDGKISIGSPNVKGAKVTGKVIKQALDKKKVGMKKLRRSQRNKFGHRQKLTVVEITGIS